jgi:ABC-type multidrug transport system fused ATPase/permease subunit
MPSFTFPKKTQSLRRDLAISRANLVFLSSIPRYFMELVLTIGVIVVSVGTFIFSGPDSVPAALVIFAAAGFRMLPSINRIQSLILQIYASTPTILLSNELVAKSKDASDKIVSTHMRKSNIDADSILSLENVHYSYPGSVRLALRGVTFNFKTGLRYAVVGPSGGGKSTLIDICLGIISPSIGSRNLSNPNFIIGYVPQDTPVATGDLLTNVTLEYSSDFQNLERFTLATELASISDLESIVSPHNHHLGTKMIISGGQQQRIGLARALYRNPDILILDEATSSLDSVTEYNVMQAVKSRKETLITIIVAHRLSTVKEVDEILYIEDGKLVGHGTFEDLVKRIPNFAHQVEKSTFQVDIID